MSRVSPKIAVHGNSREAEYLRDMLALIDALAPAQRAALHIIAPHPFAHNVADLQAQFTPNILLRRPGWQPDRADNWHRLNTPQDAANWLADNATSPVLIALGNERLAPFYALKSTPLFIRSRKAPHPPAPPTGAIVVEPGPFTETSEIGTFRRHNICTVVAHDAGGQGGWPKIAAARALGLPVVLLSRNIWPDGPKFEDVATLWQYLRVTLGLDLPPYAP